MTNSMLKSSQSQTS